jgi:hypothetical protein
MCYLSNKEIINFVKNNYCLQASIPDYKRGKSAILNIVLGISFPVRWWSNLSGKAVINHTM